MTVTSTRVPYEQLRRPINTGAGFPSLLWQISQAVLPQACTIYRQNPNVGFQFIPGGSSTPFGRIQRAFMESLCEPHGGVGPQPPADTGDPQGGQCQAQYRINYSVALTRNGIAQAPYTSFINLYGRFRGLEGLYEGDDQYRVYGTGGTQQNPNAILRVLSVAFSNVQANGNRYSQPRVTSIVRIDGQPDNCGVTPLPTYPPAPVPPEVNIPIRLPSGVLVNIPVNIRFNPQIDIPVRVEISPNVSIDFDFGGVTFNFPNEPGEDVDLTPVLDAVAGVQNTLNNSTNPKIDDVQNTLDTEVKPKLDSIEAKSDAIQLSINQIEEILTDQVLVYLEAIETAVVTAIPNTLTQIIDLINALDFDCICEPDTAAYNYTYSEIESGTGQTGEVFLEEDQDLGTPWGMVLRIDQVPSNAKVEAGTRRNPIYYAGWSTFGVYAQATTEPRDPVHFRSNFRFIPDQARVYLWALREGYNASVSIIYRKRVEENT